MQGSIARSWLLALIFTLGTREAKAEWAQLPGDPWGNVIQWNLTPQDYVLHAFGNSGFFTYYKDNRTFVYRYSNQQFEPVGPGLTDWLNRTSLNLWPHKHAGRMILAYQTSSANYVYEFTDSSSQARALWIGPENAPLAWGSALYFHDRYYLFNSLRQLMVTDGSEAGTKRLQEEFPEIEQEELVTPFDDGLMVLGRSQGVRGIFILDITNSTSSFQALPDGYSGSILMSSAHSGNLILIPYEMIQGHHVLWFFPITGGAPQTLEIDPSLDLTRGLSAEKTENALVLRFGDTGRVAAVRHDGQAPQWENLYSGTTNFYALQGDGSQVYFLGDGSQPYQLWTSDGTAAGTRSLPIYFDSSFAGGDFLQGRFYFAYKGRFYRSSADHQSIELLHEVGNHHKFNYKKPDTIGLEIFYSNSTGTKMWAQDVNGNLRETNPDYPEPAGFISASHWYKNKRYTFFSEEDGIRKFHLSKYDGTSTVLQSWLNESLSFSFVEDGQLFFRLYGPLLRLDLETETLFYEDAEAPVHRVYPFPGKLFIKKSDGFYLWNSTNDRFELLISQPSTVNSELISNGDTIYLTQYNNGIFSIDSVSVPSGVLTPLLQNLPLKVASIVSVWRNWLIFDNYDNFQVSGLHLGSGEIKTLQGVPYQEAKAPLLQRELQLYFKGQNQLLEFDQNLDLLRQFEIPSGNQYNLVDMGQGLLWLIRDYQQFWKLQDGQTNLTPLSNPTVSRPFSNFPVYKGSLVSRGYNLHTGSELYRITESEELFAAELRNGEPGSNPHQATVIGEQVFVDAIGSNGVSGIFAYCDQPEMPAWTYSGCRGSEVRISVTEPGFGATFTWNLLAGGTIVGNSDSDTLTVQSDGNSSLSLRLQLQLACGITLDVTRELELEMSSPTAPVVAGPAVLCNREPVTFTITNDLSAQGVTYRWQLPDGWILLEGQESATIRVLPATTSGELLCSAINTCGETLGSFPVHYLVSGEPTTVPTYFSCDTTLEISATPIETLPGTWTILEGDGGSFADATSAQTLFTGVTGTSYRLAWSQDAGSCGLLSTETHVNFIEASELAVVGPTIRACDGTTRLNATAVSQGSGSWSYVSGPQPYSIEDPHDPETLVTGVPGTYLFRWTVSAAGCSDQSADLEVTFLPTPEIHAISSSSTLLEGQAAFLRVEIPDGTTGSWRVVSGPSTEPGQIFHGNAQLAIFSPWGGPGTYVINWSSNSSECSNVSADVSLNYSEVPGKVQEFFDEDQRPILAPKILKPLENRLYFFDSNNQLYANDGQSLTARKVITPFPGAAIELDIQRSDIKVFFDGTGDQNGYLFRFHRMDEQENFELLWEKRLGNYSGFAWFIFGNKIGFLLSNELPETEFWLIDSSTGIVEKLAQIQGSVSPYDNNISWVKWDGNYCYFKIRKFINQHQIWKSDGTSAGTIFTGVETNYSDLDIWGGFGDGAYFSANYSLYYTDGTNQGSDLLPDPNPDTFTVTKPVSFFPIGGTSYFIYGDLHPGSSLWFQQTNGTTSGTTTLLPGFTSFSAKEDKERLFLNTFSGSTSRLYEWDGLTARQSPQGIAVNQVERLNQHVYFDDGQTKQLLRLDDDLSQPTPLFQPVPSSGNTSSPLSLESFQDDLLIGLSDGLLRFRPDSNAARAFTAPGSACQDQPTEFIEWLEAPAGYQVEWDIHNADLISDNGLGRIELLPNGQGDVHLLASVWVDGWPIAADALTIPLHGRAYLDWTRTAAQSTGSDLDGDGHISILDFVLSLTACP